MAGRRKEHTRTGMEDNGGRNKGQNRRNLWSGRRLALSLCFASRVNSFRRAASRIACHSVVSAPLFFFVFSAALTNVSFPSTTFLFLFR